MTQPYDIPGKKKHDTNKWKWVDLDKDNDPKTKAGYWELKGTPKPYNRSEYAMAKIEGRPPGHGTDASETTETDEIEQKLKDSGFTVSDDGVQVRTEVQEPVRRALL